MPAPTQHQAPAADGSNPAIAPPAGAPHLLDASMFWNGSGLGGVQRTLLAKRACFQRDGWRHTLLAPAVSGPDNIDAGGLPIPASGGYRFVVARARAARQIELAAPDIVEAADPYTLGWAVLDATARLKVPAVAFCHSDLPSMMARLVGGADGTRTRRGRWMERHAADYLARLYSAFDLVLAPSRRMTTQLQSLGVQRAVHQPLGVDTAVFAPSANDPRWRDRLEDRLGLAPGTRLLVYAGRFAPEKNLDVLAEAVHRLGPGHALLCIGTGPRPPRGLGVHVLPPEPDARRLARLIASADAFVHAGDQETFGLAALEAMACGTPIVVSAAGGLGELAEDCGITVASRQPNEWADAIAASLDDATPSLGRRALERARTLDWKRVCEQMARRYLQQMRVPQPGSAGTAPVTRPQVLQM